MKKILPILILAALAVGCKPTEKNYQQAYDLAVQKREESLTSISGGTLDAIDGPRKEVIEGDTILVATGTFMTYEAPPEPSAVGKIGIAVAQYGMDTNAKRHAADLRKKYPGAFVATDGRKQYYVVVDRVLNTKEAVKPIAEFKKNNPDFRYIGLPSGPVAILLMDRK